MVTLLSGGTGTPKLLWGADGLLDPTGVTIVGNTGDDVVLGDLHVSPDLDTVLFSQGDVLDRERWWGIADDPTTTHDRVGELGAAVGLDSEPRYLSPDEQTEGRRLSRWRRFARVPEFMEIGDRDRALHMVRTQLLEAGGTLTAVTERLAAAYGLDVRLLPMSDDPVATIVHTAEGPLHFQEYWVGRRAAPAVQDVEFRGAEGAALPDAVTDALTEPVIIGPANPVTSLGPMRALPGFNQALDAVPTVMVSPFVERTVFSGPAASLMEGTGRAPSTAGVAAMLPEVDAFVLDSEDETPLERPTVRTDTTMATQEDATRVFETCLNLLSEVS